MNRPRYTPQQMIEAVAATRGMVTFAAERLRCDPEAVRNYVKRHPAVAQALREERERTTDIAELKLFQAIQQGKAWAIMFYLKTQGKGRGYVERHELTGADGESIRIQLSWHDGASAANGNKQTAKKPADEYPMR